MLAQLKSAVPFWISGMVFCAVSTMYFSCACGAMARTTFSHSSTW